MAALASDWLTHFQFFLKNGCRDLFQTWRKYCFLGPDKMLLLFKWIRNPIWPPWSLTGWHIFNFSRTTAGIYSKHVTNISYREPTKCCYFLSGSEIQYGRPGLWLADKFQLLLKNGCRDLLQTWHKCSLWGPDQVLLLFKWIQNRIWTSLLLIGWHTRSW